MQSLIPEYLDLLQKADSGCDIEGVWPISRLPRLAELLVETEGDLVANLRIGRLDKLRYLTGSVSCQLNITCQRCLETMELTVKSEFKLGLISNEAQADNLPEGYEPFLVGEDKTSIPEILEDELLLAMPLVAMHDYDCSEYLQEQEKRRTAEAELEAQEKVKNNPFSALKDLL